MVLPPVPLPLSPSPPLPPSLPPSLCLSVSLSLCLSVSLSLCLSVSLSLPRSLARSRTSDVRCPCCPSPPRRLPGHPVRRRGRRRERTPHEVGGSGGRGVALAQGVADGGGERGGGTGPLRRRRGPCGRGPSWSGWRWPWSERRQREKRRTLLQRRRAAGMLAWRGRRWCQRCVEGEGRQWPNRCQLLRN